MATCIPLLEGEREWLLARIERKKDLTLHELLAELRDEQGVVVCCDTQWRYLRRCGKTVRLSTSGTDLRLGFKDGLGFVVVTKVSVVRTFGTTRGVD